MIVDDIQLYAAPRNGRAQRVVAANWPGGSHRENLDTNSAVSREKFIQRLARKTGLERDALEPLDAKLVRKADDADEEAEDERDERDERKPKTQATILVELASDAELWRTPDGTAYASIEIGDHREHWPIRSKGFRQWLARRYFGVGESTPNTSAINDATNVIEGRALFDGEEHAVHVRVAEHNGRVYIDLANPAWQAVEIDVSGWRVVDNPPARFRRAKAMIQLPTPKRGGSLAALRGFLNVRPEDWPLVVGWLVGTFNPRGPYPLLCLHGEAGTGKSTAARVLRALVDPSTAPVRCEPREPRELMIAANNSWIVALDNVSRVQVWLSDALCRLATGGGFSTRELYSDSDEVIFDAMRPAVLTGIEEVGTRGDLLDRSLLVSLEPIPETRRMPERVFWEEFEKHRPAILGGLLDAVAMAVKHADTTVIDRLPRMADFSLWVVAAEVTLGLQRGEFLASYADNRASGHELAVESSPAGGVIVEMMQTTTWWEGTAAELLAAIESVATEKTRGLRAWPKTARALGGIVRRLAPDLRALGIAVEFGRQHRGRVITLQRDGPCR
jgi:hypothetical protein